jgi:hypothetical protein
MSDEQITNPHMGDHGSYEREDLSARGVIYFMIGLAVVVVIIYFIVFGMYRFLDTYETAHQPAMSPMVTPQADTRTITHEDTQVFPQPRLEENERTQLRQFIEGEDRKLATYNWVDKDKGVVQIPIDRAMDLIVERGLPVRPEGSTGAQTSALVENKKKTPKAAASKAAVRGN